MGCGSSSAASASAPASVPTKVAAPLSAPAPASTQVKQAAPAPSSVPVKAALVPGSPVKTAYGNGTVAEVRPKQVVVSLAFGTAYLAADAVTQAGPATTAAPAALQVDSTVRTPFGVGTVVRVRDGLFGGVCVEVRLPFGTAYLTPDTCTAA